MAGANNKISRKEFIRKAAVGAAAVGATGLGFAKGVKAQSMPLPAGTRVVYPTGNPSVDIAAIQNAVDSANPGDTILLKATNSAGQFTPFNLGNPVATGSEPHGTILITRPMNVTGEQVTINNITHKTTITGGFATFYVDTIYGNPNAAPTGPVNFSMLESHNAVYNFIWYKACDGAAIRDIDVYDPVVAFPDMVSQLGGAVGINVRPINGPSPDYTSDKLSGDFVIERCKIDFTNSVDGALTEGIELTNIDANVTVNNCQVYNFGSRGIESAELKGKIIYTYNEFITNRMLLFFGAFRLTIAIQFGASSNNANISNNRISIDGSGYPEDEQIWAISLRDDTGGGILQNNQIAVNSNKLALNKSLNAAGIVSIMMAWSSGYQLIGNKFTGSASSGFWIGDDCNNNLIKGNDLTGLITTVSQISQYFYVKFKSYTEIGAANANNNQFVSNILGPSQLFGALISGNSNTFEGNIFGPQSNDKYPALYCDGFNNTISHNDFTQTGLKGFNVSSSQLSRAGCLFLEYGTQGNVVNVSLSDLPSLSRNSYDPCTEVADASFGLTPGNTVNRDWGPCDTNQYRQLIHMLNQHANYKVLKAQLVAALEAMPYQP